MIGYLVEGGEETRLPAQEWVSFVKENGIEAVIFDCDGTLVESGDAHYECMKFAALEQGFDLTLPWYLERTGLDRRSLFMEFSAGIAPKIDVEKAISTSIAAFGRFISMVEPIKETVSFLNDLQGFGMKIAVGTNAEKEIAQHSLKKAGVLELVDVLVSISDEVSPKPAADIFELAAQKLGKSNAVSLVLEDSPQGVLAAQNAGMRVIRVA